MVSLLGNQGADAFLAEANDFRQTAGPAGDNEGLVQFFKLFVNLKRQSKNWKKVRKDVLLMLLIAMEILSTISVSI